MTLLEAITVIEIEPSTEEEQVEAWQWLHDSGLAYTLQGWYGRQAQHLLALGVICDNA